jgi:biofilm PGA synthesis N-glycosyltransferase PgaC
VLAQTEDELGNHVTGPGAGLTVIVPAFNEAATIADTVRSLLEQTVPPASIIVVDDCSTDSTGAIAESLGTIVLRPSENTGSKSRRTEFCPSSREHNIHYGD